MMAWQPTGSSAGAKSPSPVYRAAKPPIRARLVDPSDPIADARAAYQTGSMTKPIEYRGQAALLIRTGTDRLARQASPIRRLSLPAPKIRRQPEE
jgi:hypothetical protein